MRCKQTMSVPRFSGSKPSQFQNRQKPSAAESNGTCAAIGCSDEEVLGRLKGRGSQTTTVIVLVQISGRMRWRLWLKVVIHVCLMLGSAGASTHENSKESCKTDCGELLSTSHARFPHKQAAGGGDCHNTNQADAQQDCWLCNTPDEAYPKRPCAWHIPKAARAGA